MSTNKHGPPLPPSPCRVTKKAPEAEENGEKNKARFPHPGKVNGLARRKGEKSWRKWGFNIDDSLRGHPAWQEKLPPLSTTKKDKGKGKAKNDGGKKKRSGQVLRGMFKGKKKN